MTGVGELDVRKPEAASPPPPPNPPLCPYLLLDVRDKEDYDRCHIISGTLQRVIASGVFILMNCQLHVC